MYHPAGLWTLVCLLSGLTPFLPSQPRSYLSATVRPEGTGPGQPPEVLAWVLGAEHGRQCAGWRRKRPGPLLPDLTHPFLSPPPGHLFALSFASACFSLIPSFLLIPGQVSPLLFDAVSTALSFAMSLCSPFGAGWREQGACPDLNPDG